jgi:copper resistance protein B
MKKLLVQMAMTTLFTTLSFAGSGGDMLRTNIVIDNLEYQFNNEKIVRWDTYAYIGYDLNKIYIYSEGEKADGASANSENQLVYSRAIYPYWDIQLGFDYDKTENSNKTWGVVGIQGLAPYFFDTRIVILIGEDGNIGLRVDGEYNALITQKLILTPKIALSAYSKDAAQIDIGNGFSNLTLGARLRYEFIREFAPYIGVEWSKNFGSTNNIAQSNEVYATTGLRFWF